MAKLTVNQVREVLQDVLREYSGLCEAVESMNDEELLNADMQDEFAINSLDLQEMLATLEDMYCIKVDTGCLLTEPFFSYSTVKNFIDLVDKYGHH